MAEHENNNIIKEQDQVIWLSNRLEAAIDYMTEMSKHRGKRASFLRLAATVMSATAAIALGVQVSGADQLLRNLALILVTLVTLINALEPFFNFRALWVEHETASAGFHRVKDELHFYLAGLKDSEKADPNKVKQFYLDYASVWEKHNSAWIAHRKSDDTLRTPMV